MSGEADRIRAELATLEGNLAALTASNEAKDEQIENLQGEIVEVRAALTVLSEHHDTVHHGDVEPPPTDGVQIDPGDDLIKAINSEGTSRPFLLLEGSHKLDAPIPEGKDGIQIDGVGKAIVRGSGPGAHCFHKGAARNGRLSGFELVDFGPHIAGEGGAVLSGGVGWKLADMIFRRTMNTFIELGVAGWEVDRPYMEDAGRYGYHGGPPNGSSGVAIIRDAVARRLGWKCQGGISTPKKSDGSDDNNRGFSKFGREKRGIKIFGADVESCFHGPWWDIANGDENECWDLDARDVARMGLNLEAGYFSGGGFKGGRIKVRNSGQIVKDSETNWPAPCAVQISLSGNVDLSELDLDDGRTGIGLINAADHYQLTNPKNTLSLMGVGNVRLAGVLGSNWSKWGLASKGTAHQTWPIRQPGAGIGIDVSQLVIPSGVAVSRPW